MEKRFKKQVLSKSQVLFAEPAPGLIDQCQKEMNEILSNSFLPSKFENRIHERDGFVRIENIDFRQAIELCYRASTCRDIWLILSDSHVGSYGELMKAFAKVHWEFYLSQKSLPQIEVQSFNSKLYHEGKTKELFAQYLKDLGYQRQRDDLKIRLIQNKNSWCS